MNRRDLIRALAAGGVAPAAFGKPPYRPLLAAGFYVWTQQLDREKKPLAEGIEGAIAATRRAGFRRVELMASAFEPAVEQKTIAALKGNGIEAPVVYNGGAMHERQAAALSIGANLRLADRILAAGARYLNHNPNPIGRSKTDAELAVQAEAVNQLSKQLAAKGVTLMLHHHNPEMADNAREWRHLLRNTGVPLCLDLHWVFRGAQDPHAILAEAGKRVAGIHLRNSAGGVWTEAFGAGDIDHARVAAYLRKVGYTGFLTVELAYEAKTAITRPLEDDLRLSCEYAQKTFGVAG